MLLAALRLLMFQPEPHTARKDMKLTYNFIGLLACGSVTMHYSNHAPMNYEMQQAASLDSRTNKA